MMLGSTCNHLLLGLTMHWLQICALRHILLQGLEAADDGGTGAVPGCMQRGASSHICAHTPTRVPSHLLLLLLLQRRLLLPGLASWFLSSGSLQKSIDYQRPTPRQPVC